MWIRLARGCRDDPVVHLAAFTYASDMSLLGATLVAARRRTRPKMQMASLDHTIWFHRPFRADEWWLYDQWSPSAQGAPRPGPRRGSSPRTAPLVATVAQEGLIRPRATR